MRRPDDTPDPLAGPLTTTQPPGALVGPPTTTQPAGPPTTTQLPDARGAPPTTTQPAGAPVMPSAASVLRRALMVWGFGHLTIGDRRGWLLLALQILGLAAIVVLGAALLEGSRDIVVFLALVVYLAIWAGQAIDAQRRAVALGAAPGGAIQILILAPVAITALTLFWMVGGRSGSPSAVMQRYVGAWHDHQSAAARGLFAVPPEGSALDRAWQEQSVYLGARLGSLRLVFGTGSGIDPAEPFGSLMFVDVPPVVSGPVRSGDARADVQATIAIDVMREVTVHGTFFGLFPTASQERQPVERVGTVTLRAAGRETVLGLDRGIIWRIDSVDLPPP